MVEAAALQVALEDDACRPALEHFFREQKVLATEQLVRECRRSERDVMREAALAGKVDAYDAAMQDLKSFAARAVKEAEQ